jgi:hypothetical protein
MLTYETDHTKIMDAMDKQEIQVIRFEANGHRGPVFGIIGTPYRYLHNTAGDWRIWKSPGSAQRWIRQNCKRNESGKWVANW